MKERQKPKHPASDAETNLNCPYRAWHDKERNTDGPKKPENPQASFGRRVHQLCERGLKQYYNTGKPFDDFNDEDPEVNRQARFYYSYCVGLGAVNPMIEKGVDVKSFLFVDNKQKCDFAFKLGTILYIVDLKTSKLLISAKDNYQLLVYAAGLMDDSTTEIRFRVVQPALKRVNSADIPGFVVRHWCDYVAKPCARAISLGIKGRNPGIHCLACCDPECPYFDPLHNIRNDGNGGNQ